jgi:colicin import membrane protein
LSAEVFGWQVEHELDHRRRLRNGLVVSLAVHGVFMALLVISPSRSAPPFPDVLSVDLVAAAPSVRPAPAAPPKAPPEPVPEAAPKPAPKPAPKALPKAAPEPPPPAPPPIAKAPVQALPENVPSKIRKVEPKREVDPRQRPREKELSYEDAMASLDDELGPVEDRDLLKPIPEAEPAESSGSPQSKRGVVVSPEMLAWATATTRRIQNNWKGVSSYEGRGLATSLELELSAGGDVLGTPKVIRSSGDPFFDDNAVRAVMMVSPLPAPPRSGPTVFVFKSEID